MNGGGRLVMSADDLRRTLTRIAHEIVERNRGATNLVFVGVPRPGPILARRLAEAVASFEDVQVPTGAVDISLYRDDLVSRATTPPMHPTDIPVDVTGRDVVLVDDVLHTGRSTRAALDALTDFGRPSTIQLGRSRGPRAPRTAHSRRLRGKEHPHRTLRERGSALGGIGWRRRRSHRRQSGGRQCRCIVGT